MLSRESRDRRLGLASVLDLNPADIPIPPRLIVSIWKAQHRTGVLCVSCSCESTSLFLSKSIPTSPLFALDPRTAVSDSTPVRLAYVVAVALQSPFSRCKASLDFFGNYAPPAARGRSTRNTKRAHARDGGGVFKGAPGRGTTNDRS